MMGVVLSPLMFYLCYAYAEAKTVVLNDGLYYATCNLLIVHAANVVAVKIDF